MRNTGPSRHGHGLQTIHHQPANKTSTTKSRSFPVFFSPPPPLQQPSSFRVRVTIPANWIDLPPLLPPSFHTLLLPTPTVHLCFPLIQLSIQPPPHHPPSNTNSRSLSSQFGAGPGHLSHSLLTNFPIPSHKHIATQHRPRGSITHCQPIITQRKLPPTQTHLQVKRFNPSSAHPTRTYVFCGLARAKCKSSPGFRRWLFRLPATSRSPITRCFSASPHY